MKKTGLAHRQTDTALMAKYPVTSRAHWPSVQPTSLRTVKVTDEELRRQEFGHADVAQLAIADRLSGQDRISPRFVIVSRSRRVLQYRPYLTLI